jgi:hypothetical protein
VLVEKEPANKRRGPYAGSLWASLKIMNIKSIIYHVWQFIRNILNMEKKIKVKVPNKYTELTKEISANEILEGFLGFGMFADKMYPFGHEHIAGINQASDLWP